MRRSAFELPLEAISSICGRHRVRQLALFGSALREDFGPLSDVDLLVEFEKDAEVGFVELAELRRELSALLERRVDLVPKDGLKPLIRENVLAKAEILYAA